MITLRQPVQWLLRRRLSEASLQESPCVHFDAVSLGSATDAPRGSAGSFTDDLLEVRRLESTHIPWRGH